jgi:hypothetical protein
MKKILVVLSLTAASLAAQAPGGTGATGAKAAKKTVAARKVTVAPKPVAVAPVTIPKDAIQNPNGSYSWTDKQGKNWTFVQTPFGVIKSEAPADASTPASLAGARAFDEGDKIRFEKPSPFGTVKWEKNKADLTDEERRLVENSQKAKQD